MGYGILNGKQLARFSYDESGHVNGLVGTENDYSLSEVNLPLYLIGDSLMDNTYRLVGGTGTIVFNANVNGGHIVPTSLTTYPSGSGVKVYGFADDRLNFESTIIVVGGVRVIKLPDNVSYTGLSTTLGSNAAASGESATIGYFGYTSQSIMHWASAIAGKHWKFKSLARSGATSTAISNRIADDLAYLPRGVVLIEGGVNTYKNSETDAVVEASFVKKIKAALAGFHKIIITTPTTFSSAAPSYLTSNPGLLREAAIIRRLAATYNLELIDAQSLWVDKTSATSQPKATYATADGVHWLLPFTKLFVTELNKYLERFGVAYDPIRKMGSIMDSAYTQAGGVQDALHPNKLRNGQLFGVAAALPDGWSQNLTSAPTIAHSKSASELGAADGTWTLDYTGVIGSNILMFGPSFAADVVGGKKLRKAYELEIVADTPAIRLLLGLEITGLNTGETSVYISAFAMEKQVFPAGIYTIYMVEWVIPAGATATVARPYIQIIADTAMTNQLFRFRQFNIEIS